ncbi:MAG: rhodanese-like domain-containing protein [Burkholderiaceae bacterium]
MQFFIDNIFLIGIAFVSGAMLMWPLVRSRTSGPALTTLQVTQLINSKNATVVDIRPPEEFAKGSLPNARNLPADTVKDRAGELKKQLKKDGPVIVVCANGKSAGAAAAQLRSSGFNEVFVLGGGLAAWREAGLPIRT